MIEVTTPDGPAMVNPAGVSRIELYDAEWSRVEFLDGGPHMLILGAVAEVAALLS